MIKERPILTIGIPTYNRSDFLDQCLQNIFMEINDDESFEVLVCDNGSTDNTYEVVNKYKAKYNNIIYFKHEENLGFSRNLKSVFDLARGKFINPHGDDDFFSPGIITEIVKLIQENEDCSIIRGYWRRGAVNGFKGEGIANFLREFNGINFLTAMIVNSDEYKKIENVDKYINTDINQVYIQLELLKANPKYCVLAGDIFSIKSGGAPHGGYNWIDVAINNYFEILDNYKEYGIDIQAEKLKVLNGIIHPSLSAVLNSGIDLVLEGLVESFTKYFSGESYFDEKLNEIKNILNVIENKKIK